ncbi:Swt1 family HEPN domain-containing protein [Thermosynechococcus sp. HN-54]|nr:Swt1 family HEPN domain-containing protein [Thermosynechococcus sp. HN-54]
MSISNYERVGRALNLLLEGLYLFVEREMKASYGDRWLQEVAQCLPEYNQNKSSEEVLQRDVSAVLIVIWEKWHDVFKKTLGRAERALVSELRETRNAWAHTNTFSTDDAYRALDSITRLLSAISAPQAAEVDKQKQELLRIRFEEQARNITRRTTTTPTEGQPMAGLKPWREIATLHPDVASGRFQQAEFAADLWQVYLDEGSDEYRNPAEFYRRTYLTEGLKQLLANALRRLSGQGGDPVIELQTNFGGGKTHAMLSLYHLFSSPLSPSGGEGLLPGTESIFQATGIRQPPENVNIAVLVGNKLQPSGIPLYRPEH